MLEHEANTKLKDNFLAAIAPQNLFDFLDDVPEMLFFVKDLKGHYLVANNATVRWFNCGSKQSLWGCKDSDFYPTGHAELIQSTDQTVVNTNKSHLDALELLFDRSGEPTWLLASRYPIRSQESDIIGVLTTLKKHPFLELTTPDVGLSEAIDYIKKTYYRDISIPHLASLTGVSVRQFERRFKVPMKVTPQDFIVRFRVYKSCHPLRTTQGTMAEIAESNGFYDQAAFSKLFKKHLGISPLTYRKEFKIALS